MEFPLQNASQQVDLVPSVAEQDLIQQIQAELVSVIRVTADETIESWQHPFHFGNWGSTLEGEIYRSLW